MTPRMEPIEDASVWTGADLERDRSWAFELTSEHLADLDRALQGVKARGLQLAEITRGNFLLPSVDEILRAMLHELRDGRGFAFMRGFPTEDYALDDVEKATSCAGTIPEKKFLSWSGVNSFSSAG